MHSFELISERELVVASSDRYYYPRPSSNQPPALDVYWLQGEVRRIRSFSFPPFNIDAVLNETGLASSLFLRDMEIQLSSASAFDNDHPPPFKLDPSRRSCSIKMVIGHGYLDRFNFVIPLLPITDALSGCAQDARGSSSSPDEVKWDNWTHGGVGMTTLRVLEGKNESLASQLLMYSSKILGFQGACLVTSCKQLELGRESYHLTCYDYSPFAVQRERLGLNRSHPGVDTRILEPDPHDLEQMELFFGENDTVFLPCVRIQSTKTFEYALAAADEEHIVLFKSV
jgi:hypothetical protein